VSDVAMRMTDAGEVREIREKTGRMMALRKCP
jgi:hypothetical protein